MAITGTHMLFYTSEAEKLRAMLRDVFGFKHVDAGGGWLIFRLPPAESACIRPRDRRSTRASRHQISFMCDDIHKTIAELQGEGCRGRRRAKDAELRHHDHACSCRAAAT